MLSTQIAEKFRQGEQSRQILASRLRRISLMVRLNQIALETFLQTQPPEIRRQVWQALEQEIARQAEMDGRYTQVLQELGKTWQSVLAIHEVP